MKNLILVISLAGALFTTSATMGQSSEKLRSIQQKKTDTIAPGQKILYTCPMHPDVVRDKPGNCPKCGMDLVKKEVKKELQKTVFTCPMHPEVIRDKPGVCPKCGMDLIKKVETKKNPPNVQKPNS